MIPDESISLDALHERLATGATVVAASDRLARHLRARHADRQAAAGRTVWARPDCLPWSAWVSRCWDDLIAQDLSSERGRSPDRAAFPGVLNGVQTEALWQSVIEEDAAERLLQVPGTARAAIEAWRLVCEWRVSLSDVAREADEDADAFLRWARRYRSRCEEGGWVDGFTLPDRLREMLARADRAGPAAGTALVVAGFEELAPQQAGLLEALARSGVELAFWRPAHGEPPRELPHAGMEDAEAEIRAAARHVRGVLARRPDARVGVVVHDLTARRDSVERIFDEVLTPAVGANSRRVERRPYNISVGTPLAAEPIVHDAFLLLGLARREVDFGDASRVLRSPFVRGADAERAGRAGLETELRRIGQVRVRTSALRGMARSSRLGRPAPRLAERLDGLLDGANAVRGRKPPSEWSRRLPEWLDAAGWPGDRSPDSREFQAVQALREVFANAATLDAVCGPLGLDEMLSRLRRMASDTLFQPRSEQVPVQVLGTIEALGQSFDSLWIAGWHDGVWPERPRPTPYLPIRLQRRLGLPHSTGERELAFGRRVTRALLGSAPEVVVSWPRREGDTLLRPSPLIPRDGEVPPEALNLPEAPDSDDACLAGGRVEALAGDYRLSLRSGEKPRGGTRLLTDQSACPFRAFANHRLGAEALERPAPGLSALDRGLLLHDAVERFWQDLPGQAELLALSPDALDTRIGEVVEAAVARFAQRRPDIFTKRFRAVEIARLRNLLHRWMERERDRVPFRVRAREETRTVPLGLLTLRTRIDRIDEIDNVGTVVIDYKTGRAGRDAWIGDRPAEPQLPLYAIDAGRDLAGVVFARLRADDVRFDGVTRDPDLIGGVKTVGDWKKAREAAGDWDGLLARWREALQGLADEVVDGRADVTPQPGACRHCHVYPLCRIDELDTAAREKENGDNA